MGDGVGGYKMFSSNKTGTKKTLLFSLGIFQWGINEGVKGKLSVIIIIIR